MTNEKLPPTSILLKLKFILPFLTINVLMFAVTATDPKNATFLTKISASIIMVILFLALLILYKQVRTAKKEAEEFLKNDE